MKVLIMLDGLVFVGLTDEQMKKVINLSDGAKVKDTAKGLKVQSEGSKLYTMLYKLSFEYDIDIV